MKWGAPVPLVVNIVANYCRKRKMLKETETEGTIDFFVTFLSVATFQLGEAAPSYAYGTSVYCATAK